ncbi:MAG: Gfo/Idh/MocA family oxidoreductase, partial [Acidimicrobiia bacterium]|nr:Gfo/Idh/MocA family oxidoreductase [Acidimicrobiia bacterium]
MMETIRYGIIGAGMMGIEHIHNINHIDGADVVAVGDPIESSRRQAAAEASGEVAQFEDYRDLLASDLVDAVVVATPNMTHADVMDDVLAVPGMHVMLEKPMATSVADCRRIVAAAEGHTGVVWIGLEYRYMPAAARLIPEIENGTVGTLRHLAIREHRFPFLPKVGNWNRFNRNTGGTLVEKCCHFFYLMNLIIGASPVRVMASGGQDFNHREEKYNGEVPDILDAALVIFDYDNGARSMLDLCMYAEATKHQEEIVAVGDLGKIEALTPGAVMTGSDLRQLVRIGNRAVSTVEEHEVTDDRILWEGGHHGSSYIEHLEFIDAIRSGAPAAVTVEDGLLSVAMGLAAQTAIAEKRVVEMA